jgi:glycine cleavage system transcriptional repressor
MKSKAILSAFGSDRVGIAGDLSMALANRRVEIEDSRMTALGGRFAVILRVSGDQRDITSLSHELDTLRSNLGFQLHLETVETPQPPKSGPRYLIECLSPRPSGLNGVTAVLKSHSANIEDLKTESTMASLSGEITFHMTLCITIPQSCPVVTLREELREIERQHDLDIVITPLPSSVGEGSPVPTTNP